MNWEDVLYELDDAPFDLLETFDLEKLTATHPMLCQGVRALQRHGGAKTLADLADATEMEDVLRMALPRQERRAFLKGFGEALRELLQSDEPPVTAPAARRDVGADVPRTSAELAAWAERHGVSGDLERRIVRVMRSPNDRRAATFTLLEMLDVERFPQAGKKEGFERESVRLTALPTLREIIAARAPEMAKRSAFVARKRAPEDPWTSERVAVLAAEIDRLPQASRRRAIPMSLQYPVAFGRFEPRPPAIHVTLQQVEHSVDLLSGSVSNRGGYWQHTPERDELTRAILEYAIDALSDPEGGVSKAVVAFRSKPVHEHLLDDFRRALAKRGVAEGEGAERVAFRLPIDPARGAAGRVPLVLLQRSKKGGSFSAGRKVSAAEALHTRDLTTLERELLELCVLLDHSRYSAIGEPLQMKARLFDLLSEHPRIYLGDDQTPGRVRRGRGALRVLACKEGYRFELAVGGVALALDDFAPERLGCDRLVVARDARSSTIHFAVLDDSTLALIAALKMTPDALSTEGLDAVLGAITAFPEIATDLDLPEEVRGTEVKPSRALVVQLTFANDGGITAAIRVRPIASGQILVPGAGPLRTYGAEGDRRVFVVRDLENEDSRARQLVAQLALPGIEPRGAFDLLAADPESACDLVAVLGELSSAGTEEIVLEWSGAARVRIARTLSPRSLRLRIERKRDWFGIAGGVEIDGQAIGIQVLIAAARAGRRWVRMESGDLVAIDAELRSRLSRASDVLHEAKDGGVIAQPPALSAVEGLVEREDEQLVVAKEWLELRARVRSAEASEPELPDGLTADLRHYQIDGYRWLMRLAACGSGGCLADDMGLGKTLQSLAVLVARKDLGPALVVAPTSVCANWLAEAARFAPEMQCASYRGSSRRDLLETLGPGSVLVTSYDLLLRDIEQLASIAFATAVFDEAHALKNAHAKRTAAVRRVRADVRFALTGTPVENHTGELWSLFRVVVPGLFGSWESFRERFAGPIERDRDPSRRAALVRVVTPYLLRRTKSEVAPELPPRTEIVRFVDLSAAERELYEAERLRAIAKAHAEASRPDGEARFALLAALTRLRQLACHPRLRDPSSTLASAKLASVLSLIEELKEAGHRALVFSQFTTHLDLVAEALAPMGIRFFELQGSTPAEDRAERVRRFQAGEGDVFLVSLKAGGTGLNLTAADYVVHLDPWWNPAAEDQASDRAHRIGQDKPVTVVRVITRGTIEESVLALHGEKRELAEAILSGGDVAARLSTGELFALMEKSVREDVDLEEEGADSGPQ